MPIDRTKYNALIDDTGANDGTVWNKQQIKDVLLDPIDAELLQPDSLSVAGAASFTAATGVTIPSGPLAVGANVQGSLLSGDIDASRTDGTTGYIFFGKNSKWIGFDGTNFSINGPIAIADLVSYKQKIVALTPSANAITMDLGAAEVFTCVLNQNLTTLSLTNYDTTRAYSFLLRLTQDGTGGRTVAFQAGWKVQAGWTMSSGANKTDIMACYYDATVGACASPYITNV